MGTHAQWVPQTAAQEVQAFLCAQVRGIKFYDVPLDEVKELRLRCELD